MNKKSHGFAYFHQLVVILLLWLSITQVSKASIVPSPPKLDVTSYMLMDVDSGKILAKKEENKPMHPASLTKMMTAYIGEMEIEHNNIKRNDLVLISQKAWKMEGSTMFLEVGDRVSVQNIMKGIIIISGNDASVALAEHVAGSEDGFVQMMNAVADNLGMVNTHFMNASGWPSKNHYSTAQDLAILAKHIIKDYPEYYGLYAMKYFQYGVNKRTGEPLHRQNNRNRLLWTNSSVDGLKTGHIEKTGYHLAVTASKKGRRLVAVIMGAKSERQRAKDAQKVLTYGFRFFENTVVQKANQLVKNIRIWKGKKTHLDLVIDKNLVVTVPRQSSKSLKKEIEVKEYIEAPIKKGQNMGVLKIIKNKEVIRTVPLLAKNTIEQASFFSRLWDTIELFVIRLF